MVTHGRGGGFISSSKAHARAVLRAARAQVTPEQRAIESEAAVRALFESGLLDGARSIALYAARDFEADPSGLEALSSRGIAVAYPRALEDGELAFHLARAEELIAVPPWNIREPAPGSPPATGIDVYLVPGLGFTREGDRLGHGKGFYDRVLLDRGDALAIGFAFSCQLVDHVPTEEHDVRVDAVVTGSELIVVKS